MESRLYAAGRAHTQEAEEHTDAPDPKDALPAKAGTPNLWRPPVAQIEVLGVHEPTFQGEPHVGRSLNRGWPNSTGLAFSSKVCVMTPLTSALISFMTFIASMMQTTVSGPTSVPTS